MAWQVYVENEVAMRYDAGSTVWCFDQTLWGDCVQGETESQALAKFQDRFGPYEVV